LVDYVQFTAPEARPLPLAFGALEALAVLAVGVPLTRLAVRSLRRLSPTPAR